MPHPSHYPTVIRYAARCLEAEGMRTDADDLRDAADHMERLQKVADLLFDMLQERARKEDIKKN